jgi:hypothetical protein
MNFRTWCCQKWYDHCDEVEAWTGRRPQYLSQEYFNKYKWWLRREYQSELHRAQKALQVRQLLIDVL